MEKRCNVCGMVKPLEDFYRMAGMRDGHRNDCRACNLAAKARRYRRDPEAAKERTRRWREENPEKYANLRERMVSSGRKQAADRRSHLKRKYGITAAEYGAMLAAQAGGCAVCRRKPPEGKSLHVDHDHETGAVRGLLCFSCNSALGNLHEDEERISALLSYLESFDPDIEFLAQRTKRRLAALHN